MRLSRGSLFIPLIYELLCLASSKKHSLLWIHRRPTLCYKYRALGFVLVRTAGIEPATRGLPDHTLYPAELRALRMTIQGR